MPVGYFFYANKSRVLVSFKFNRIPCKKFHVDVLFLFIPSPFEPHSYSMYNKSDDNDNYDNFY